MAADAELRGVGATALGAAIMRAQESKRPDALFDDPYAAAFVAAAPRPFEDVPDPDGELARIEAEFQVDVALRTRFFDDYVTSAVSNGIRQVILLGAGLDTRAFRLRLPPATRVFELDVPEVLAFKEEVLRSEGASPSCVRASVPVDLRAGWAEPLVGAGFKSDVPSAWTAEGLVAYLEADEGIRLLKQVTQLAVPGSEFSFEQARTSDDSALARASSIEAMSGLASMWHDATAIGLLKWLQAEGWTATTYERSVLARSYRRDPGSTTAQFVTAVFGRST